MTISYNSANASAVNVISSLATTNAVTLPSAPTPGNKIVYFVAVDKNATAFTPPAGFTPRATVTAASVSLFVAEKTAVGNETGPIAATWTTSRASKAIVFEVATTASMAFDVATQNNSETASTTISTGSVTTGANAAFALVFLAKDSAKSAVGDADPTPSWSNEFVTQAQNWHATPSGDPGLVVGAGAVSPNSSASSTFSHNGSSDQLAAAILVFSETGGGTPSGRGALLAQHRNRRIFA